MAKDKKTLLSLLLAGIISVASIGCDNGLKREINRKDYLFKGNKVTELAEDKDNFASYGVISDPHCNVKKARDFANYFKRQGVNGIIIPGDIPLNEKLRYGREDSRKDKSEIVDILSAVAETGLPVFVIPGNHETKKDYKAAIKEVTEAYPNVIDMVKYRVFDGDDADFVSLPGYQVNETRFRKFIPDGGYWTSPPFIKRTGKLRKNLNDSVILISHGPGKTGAKKGPGTTVLMEEIGDENIRDMQIKDNIPFAVTGHVHEAGGFAANFNGKNIKEGEFATQVTVNFGTLEDHLDLNGKK
ncbi:MAG: metallophosphoesterase, partial [Nanoarchaeota archaeon]